VECARQRIFEKVTMLLLVLWSGGESDVGCCSVEVLFCVNVVALYNVVRNHSMNERRLAGALMMNGVESLKTACVQKEE
jgi:hypothetical protein